MSLILRPCGTVFAPQKPKILEVSKALCPCPGVQTLRSSASSYTTETSWREPLYFRRVTFTRKVFRLELQSSSSVCRTHCSLLSGAQQGSPPPLPESSSSNTEDSQLVNFSLFISSSVLQMTLLWMPVPHPRHPRLDKHSSLSLSLPSLRRKHGAQSRARRLPGSRSRRRYSRGGQSLHFACSGH